METKEDFASVALIVAVIIPLSLAGMYLFFTMLEWSVYLFRTGFLQPPMIN